ncbi:hypothetical protein [Streptomyces broussonetiae]|uniref:hypothetical protein n=1 Tax=Streptomyces broussonetiae TaxID=2686304 RepID=UPI0035DD288D
MAPPSRRYVTRVAPGVRRPGIAVDRLAARCGAHGLHCPATLAARRRAVHRPAPEAAADSVPATFRRPAATASYRVGVASYRVGVASYRVGMAS